MSSMSPATRSLRCRLGLHHWQTHRIADGLAKDVRAVENNANQRNGIEVTVRLDSGRTIAVPQENSGENFRPGDRVRVLSDGYTTRVAY